MFFKWRHRSVSSEASSAGEVPRSVADVFFEALLLVSPRYKNIVLLNAGLAPKLLPPEVPRVFGDRYVDLGRFTLDVLSQAVGFSLTGKTPIVLGTASAFSGRGLELIQQTMGEPLLNIKLVGLASELFSGIPSMTNLVSEDVQTVRGMAERLCTTYGPMYVQLSTQSKHLVKFSEVKNSGTTMGNSV